MANTGPPWVAPLYHSVALITLPSTSPVRPAQHLLSPCYAPGPRLGGDRKKHRDTHISHVTWVPLTPVMVPFLSPSRRYPQTSPGPSFPVTTAISSLSLDRWAAPSSISGRLPFLECHSDCPSRAQKPPVALTFYTSNPNTSPWHSRPSTS